MTKQPKSKPAQKKKSFRLHLVLFPSSSLDKQIIDFIESLDLRGQKSAVMRQALLNYIASVTPKPAAAPPAPSVSQAVEPARPSAPPKPELTKNADEIPTVDTFANPMTPERLQEAQAGLSHMDNWLN